MIKYSDEVIGKLRSLAEVGISVTDASRALGVSTTTIIRWASLENINLLSKLDAQAATRERRFAADRETVISAKKLREILSYDPLTGVFRWLVNRGRTAKIGLVAGRINGSGHRQIRFGNRAYAAHRLAWLYMTGEWPAEDIDHRDCVPDNNRWANLREASRSQNLANVGLRRDNTSGKKGAHWHKATGRWSASICADGRQYHLGLFDGVDDAHAAYVAAATRLFGEFARAA